jgi:P-type conjugative transfer protein TrbG
MKLVACLHLPGAWAALAPAKQPFREKGPTRLDEEEFFGSRHLGEGGGRKAAWLQSASSPAYAPTTMPGQLRPIPARESAEPPVRPDQAIDAANEMAAIEPHPDNYMNAIQIYPYATGALYQVYCAPEQVTDIALQPGEQLMSVSAGDTVRWVLGDTVSGTGEDAQVHILVKPIQSGLRTNLIITTSRRAYHLELTAFNETYMAAVSWRYSDQPLVRRTSVSADTGEARSGGLQGLQLERLQFRYDIDGDEPHWRPERVFDDGRKVYIQFPGRLDQGEAPPLFVVGRDGQSQLVNYRMRENYYVVDRLFARAELRLGDEDQDVVRISRSDLGRDGR